MTHLLSEFPRERVGRHPAGHRNLFAYASHDLPRIIYDGDTAVALESQPWRQIGRMVRRELRRDVQAPVLVNQDALKKSVHLKVGRLLRWEDDVVARLTAPACWICNSAPWMVTLPPAAGAFLRPERAARMFAERSRRCMGHPYLRC